MMDPDLPPLSLDVARLLDAERSRPDPSADFRARLTERLAADVLDGAVLGDGRSTLDAASASKGTPAAGGAPAASPPPGIGRLARLSKAVALLLVGAAGGAGLNAALREPAIVHVPAPQGPQAPHPVPASSRLPEPRTEPATDSSVAPARPLPPSRPVRHADKAPSAAPPAPASAESAPSQAPLTRDQELASERALIERARSALARGKPDDALEAIARHRRDFAAGQLVEERCALEILALAVGHNLDEARRRAAEFRRTYPGSMLRRTIDQALDAKE